MKDQNLSLRFKNNTWTYIAPSVYTIQIENIQIHKTLIDYYDKDIKIICANGVKRCYSPIIVNVIVDYEK